MSVSKKWPRPLFRVFARGGRRAAAPILRSRAGGEPPLPYCAPAPGRLYAEKQRKYGRPATGPKKVWPSGHRTKESMAVRPPDQRGAPPLRSVKSHAQAATFCGFIRDGTAILFVVSIFRQSGENHRVFFMLFGESPQWAAKFPGG